MGPGGGRRVGSGDSDFVVVANRLPVDLERLPDGTTRWKRSPGGLVTALEPFLRTARAPGSAGRASPTPTTTRSSRKTCSCTRCRCAQRRSPTTTRASPTRRCGRCTTTSSSSRLPPRLVGALRRGQPAFRRGHVAGRGAGRDGVDPGLPAAAGAEDAAHAAARPHHRILPAHPVPAGGAVHADAVADRDRRGPARRRPGRLPPARRRAELPVPGATPRRCEHLAGDRRRALPLRRGAGRLPHREGRRVPDLHRLRRTRRSPATEASESGPGRSARSWATRARSCWASTGWTTPRASTSGCGRFRSCSTSIGPIATTRSWSSWPRRAANASRATR